MLTLKTSNGWPSIASKWCLCLGSSKSNSSRSQDYHHPQQVIYLFVHPTKSLEHWHHPQQKGSLCTKNNSRNESKPTLEGSQIWKGFLVDLSLVHNILMVELEEAITKANNAPLSSIMHALDIYSSWNPKIFLPIVLKATLTMHKIINCAMKKSQKFLCCAQRATVITHSYQTTLANTCLLIGLGFLCLPIVHKNKTRQELQRLWKNITYLAVRILKPLTHLNPLNDFPLFHTL